LISQHAESNTIELRAVEGFYGRWPKAANNPEKEQVVCEMILEGEQEA
jgi:hypothetical protein